MTRCPGAYDVRYGNALSGVVEVKLKEGGEEFSGGVTMTSGAYATSESAVAAVMSPVPPPLFFSR